MASLAVLICPSDTGAGGAALVPMVCQISFASIFGAFLQYCHATDKVPAGLAFLVQKVSRFTQRCDLGKPFGKCVAYALTSIFTYESIEAVAYLANGIPLWYHILGTERLKSAIHNESPLPTYSFIHIIATTFIPLITISAISLCSDISRDSKSLRARCISRF